MKLPTLWKANMFFLNLNYLTEGKVLLKSLLIMPFPFLRNFESHIISTLLFFFPHTQTGKNLQKKILGITKGKLYERNQSRDISYLRKVSIHYRSVECIEF